MINPFPSHHTQGNEIKPFLIFPFPPHFSHSLSIDFSVIPVPLHLLQCSSLS